MMVIAVALGGAMGAVLRYGIGHFSYIAFGGAFPYATLIVNILGCFLMGALVIISAVIWSPSPEMRVFLQIGFLGALTTFSSFALDISHLWKSGEVLLTCGYIVGSVALSLLAFSAGLSLFRFILER